MVHVSWYTLQLRLAYSFSGSQDRDQPVDLHAALQHIFLRDALSTFWRDLGTGEAKGHRHGAEELEEQLEGLADCHGFLFHVYPAAIQERICGRHCDWMADLPELAE